MVDHAESLLDTIRALGVLRVERQGRHVLRFGSLDALGRPVRLRDRPAKRGDWHLKRSLFDYLSLTTLTSLGYSDITPVGQPAYSLTWLEMVVGQFYMAVVVAQLVGLKLAQAISRAGSGAG
jgi:hypothetical protein